MGQRVPDLLRQSLSSFYLVNSRAINTHSNTKVLENDQSIVHSEEWLSAKPTSEIPGPTRFEMIRGLLPGGIFYKKQPTELLDTARTLYGDFFVFPGLFRFPPFYISYNPDDFPVAARSEGVWPQRRPMGTLVHYRTKHRKEVFKGIIGLLGSNGEEWSSLRSKVNPILMNQKNVRLHVDKMQGVNNEFIQRIREIRDSVTMEVPSTFENEINRLTFESIAIVALDQQIGLIRKKRDNPEVENLFKSFRSLINLTYELDLLPSIWTIIKTPKFYQMMRALDSVTDVAIKYINQTVERIEQEAKTHTIRTEEKSILEKILKIDQRFAIVMALDLLMGGVDTTSFTITGMLLCIAKNPEKQAKLREEICKILPEKDSLFTPASLQDLSYLRACIKEGLRIYPPISGVPRSNSHEIVLSGYRIPKNSDIALSPHLLHKSDKYFPKASEFIPERWLRNDKGSMLPSNSFIYTPFGFGPRSCVGKRLVDLELEINLARLVRNFHIEFNYSTENAFKSALVNIPAIPLKFKFSEVEN